MKKILLFALFLLIVNANFSNDLQLCSTFTSSTFQTIENGTYSASVTYYNEKTYTRSSYTLNVTVNYDRVVAIHFGNGGSLHTGYNNEGYTYSGGTLSFKRDYNGNIIGAYTTVEISESSNPYKVVRYSINI